MLLSTPLLAHRKENTKALVVVLSYAVGIFTSLFVIGCPSSPILLFVKVEEAIPSHLRRYCIRHILQPVDYWSL
jgi:hypothetical protein